MALAGIMLVLLHDNFLTHISAVIRIMAPQIGERYINGFKKIFTISPSYAQSKVVIEVSVVSATNCTGVYRYAIHANTFRAYKLHWARLMCH